MAVQLLVNLKVERKHFLMEDYLGSDDIFALVKEGQFVFESPHGRFTVRENEGCLFRRDTLYHREIISPVTMYLFRYRSDEVVLDDHVIFQDQDRIRSTIAMLEQLDRGIFKNEFEQRAHLFCDLITQYTIESGMTAQKTNNSDPLVEKAIFQISKKVHGKLSLAMIGRETGLSYVQFLRRFQAYTGMSPTDYVTALRLQKAKTLLTDTDMLIREISAVCGFENEYYFSNFFKKHLDVSPTEFRNMTQSLQ